MTKPSVSEKRRYVKLRKILRNKMLTQALKYVGGALDGLGSPKNEPPMKGYCPPDVETACRIILPGGADIGTEIDMRADWLMVRYVAMLEAALEDLQSIRNYSSKLGYIKKNFWDVFSVSGKIEKNKIYDMAAPMSRLTKLNEETGDLDGFIPKDGGSALTSVAAFEKYAGSKYKKCVRGWKPGKTSGAKGLDISILKPGMLLLQRPADGRKNLRHLVVYAGAGKVLSFNRDGIYNVKSDLDTVIVDLPEIVRQEWKERLGDYRLDDEEELLALRTDLYIGRESDFRKGLTKLKYRRHDSGMTVFHPVARAGSANEIPAKAAAS